MTQDALGHLEMQVMEVLWARGESNVSDAVLVLKFTGRVTQ